MTGFAGKRSSGRRLFSIYNSLLEEYGPQGWWPTIGSRFSVPGAHIASAMTGKNQRVSAIRKRETGSRKPAYHPGDYSYPKTEAQRFEICAGALLAQNTSWKNAEKALSNLHSSGNLSPEGILRLPKGKLESLIRPSGYFRQKSERLKLLSRAYPGADKDTESLREHFLSVKGVGPETADSILLYAFRRPVFVIDAYTRRFCSSFRLFHGPTYNSYKGFFESRLPPDHKLFNEFHALIVEWGKRNPPG